MTRTVGAHRHHGVTTTMAGIVGKHVSRWRTWRVTTRSPHRARAKSAMCLLTCGDGAQWPESGLLSHRGALHLPGGYSTPTLLRATWRSVCRRDGLRLGPDRSLFTPGSEQVS